MKPMPWRFLVVTEMGVESEPARVTAAGLDAWLAGLGAVVELSTGTTPMRIPVTGPEVFTPAGIRAALAAARPGAAPGSPVSGDEIDGALHSPAFQRIESAWRGLRMLLEETGDAVAVDVFSVPRAKLTARLRPLLEQELDRPDSAALILLDFDFSHRPADLALLRGLAEMAKVLQAPLVAGASAAFFDLRYLVQAIALPDLLTRLRTPAHSGWLEFQSSEPARWVVLTLNRWLQRAPHTDETGYAERVTESEPDTYLWGRGAWLLGATAARSIRTYGQAVDLTGMQAGGFGGLPTRAYPTAANATAPLAVEVPLAEMQVIELSRAAFTPIVAPLRGERAFIPMAVTVHRLAPAKLTVEGTLGYQMLAGRLARFCGQMLDEMPAGGAAECAAFMRAELLGFLGPFAGEAPAEAVQVEVREETVDERPVMLADVKVRPHITLEGKAPEFAFVLPLGRV